MAQRADEVVAQVVQTMQGINDSSRHRRDHRHHRQHRLQTNILALNAAVESRAGEWGAVSPWCWRYAHRWRSVHEAARRSGPDRRQRRAHRTGSRQAEAASQTMQQVGSRAVQVSAIIGEISTANQQQSGGVQQVGQAVGKSTRDAAEPRWWKRPPPAAAEPAAGRRTEVRAVAVFRVEASASAA